MAELDSAARFASAGDSLLALAIAVGLAAAAFFVVRNWLAATIVVSAVSLAALLAAALSPAFNRPAPSPERVSEALSSGSTGDPAGWFVTTVLWVTLFGLLATVIRPAGKRSAVRTSVRAGLAAALFGVVLAGPWLGRVWVTDAVAALSLGALFAWLATRAFRAMEPTTSDVPLVHARYLDVAGERSVHALTSTILFRGETVWKIYSPGFIPRAFYWLAFQAPFGYSSKRVALEAAVHRRNLAGKLTEYWYGASRVAPALAIEDYNGQMALVSPLVHGGEPQDRPKARAFLFELSNHFDASGLPTWQIDPRQPRSLGNVMEGEDGSYTVIDLESGLVSPLASPRAWWRAVRRAQFPFYDDVFFDVTRAYVQRERASMRASHGEAWLGELESLLDNAETSAGAWHASEPRVWSRMLRWFWSGFGVRQIPRWVRAKTTSGEAHAVAWLEGAIDAWEKEGRLTSDEAATLRASAESPDVQAVMPHFGLFLAIGVALRFPIGSIARVSYSTGQLFVGTSRLALRRIDRRTWRRHAGIHSPLVILIAAMPGIGTFAYLASGPVISRRGLIRVALDAVGEHLPKHIYRRSGLRRVVAKRVRKQPGSFTVGETL